MFCPNCNKELQDGAAFCSNCGVKITICPACHIILSNEAAFCNRCGTKIANNYYNDTNNYNQRGCGNANQGTYSQSFQSQPTSDSIIKAWENESSFNKLLNTKRIGYILLILIAITTIITFVLLENYLDSINYMNLIKSYKLLKKFLFSWILFLLLWFLYEIYDNCKELLLCNRFHNWCTIHKVNIKHLIQNDLSLNYESMTKDQIKSHIKNIDLCIFCISNNQNRSFHNKIYATKIISILNSAIFSIFMYIGISKMGKEAILNSINTTQGFFTSIFDYEFLQFIIVANLIIIPIVTTIISIQIEEKEKSNWIYTNLPEYAYKYEKYIKY